MPSPAEERALAAHLATHHGVITRPALLGLGFSDHQIGRLVANGRIRRLRTGIFVSTAHEPTDLQLASAVGQLGATLGAGWSGRLWGYRKVQGLPREIIVPTGHERRPVPGGLVVRRSNRLDPVDIVTRPDGIRLLSPPRTVFELARFLEPDALESVVEQVLDREHASLATLWRTGHRLAGPGRCGAGRFLAVLAGRPAWSRPADSDHEVRVARALIAAGLEAPVLQHPLEVPGLGRVYLDLAWPRIRGFVEIDHVTWHGGRVDAQRDKRRDRKLRRIGWHGLRITDDDIDHRLSAAVDDVAAVFGPLLRAAA